ncbi:MAG: hypothetical protein ACRDFX_07445, partial [Chloroflexota bacterium]
MAKRTSVRLGLRAVAIVFVGSMLLASANLASAQSPGYRSAAVANSTFDANTVVNLSAEGKAFTEKAARPSSVSLSHVAAITGGIDLKGYVAREGATDIPFDISGPLYTTSTPGNLVGALRDGLGNFDVENFAIDASPSHDVFMTPAVARSSGEMVALYLMRRGTREFTYMDQSSATVLAGTVYANSTQAGANLASAGAALPPWFERVFAPSDSHRTQQQIPAFSPRVGSVHRLMNWIDGYSDDYYV